MIVKNILESFLQKPQKWIEDLDARQKYIVRKHLHGADDNEDKIEETTLYQLDVNEDVDGLSLYDFRVNKKMTKTEIRQNDELEKKRRYWQRELDLAQTEEKFNVETQMGETIDGRPVGLFRIRVQKITKIDTARINCTLIRVQASIRGDDNMSQFRPEFVETSNIEIPHIYGSEDFRVVDQNIGPLAPISIMSAEVVFRICRADKKSTSEILQSASILLSEFKDQRCQKIELQLLETATSVHSKGSRPGSLSVGKPKHGCILMLEVTFLYSNIIKFRQKLKNAKKELTQTEQELSNLKLGVDAFENSI